MTTFPKTSTASSPDVKGDDCAHRGQAPIFILIKEDGCHCHSMERMRHYRRSRHIDAAPPSFHETIAPYFLSSSQRGPPTAHNPSGTEHQSMRNERLGTKRGIRGGPAAQSIIFSFEENGSHQHNYESVPLSHLGNPREIRRLRASS